MWVYRRLIDVSTISNRSTPRGKGNKIQEEKDDSDMIEEDFGEAMQRQRGHTSQMTEGGETEIVPSHDQEHSFPVVRSPYVQQR